MAAYGIGFGDVFAYMGLEFGETAGDIRRMQS
jgi:hypothetical protein